MVSRIIGSIGLVEARKKLLRPINCGLHTGYFIFQHDRLVKVWYEDRKGEYTDHTFKTT